MGAKIKKILSQYTMIIVMIVLFLLFNTITEGKMLFAQNMNNLLLQNAYVIVLACAMLLCILTGGNIDLSIGSVVCLSSALGGVLMSRVGMNIYLTILICLLVGIAIGLWQGLWIGYVRIPPFIVTLAGMFLWRGTARIVLDGKTVSIPANFQVIFTSYITFPSIDNEAFKLSSLIFGIIVSCLLVVLTLINRATKKKKGYEVQGIIPVLVKTIIICAAIILYSWKLAEYKGLPVMLLWVVAIVLFYGFVTSKTAFGRHFYSVGGNEKAARLSGINTKFVYFSAYLNMAIIAAITGLLVAARLGSVNGETGSNYEMDAIGSCFIGGASAYGGVGNVKGVVVGAILMGIINQGMNIKGVDSNWQYVVKGIVLLAAVIFDVVSNKKTGKA